MSLTLSLGASAQRKGGRFYGPVTRVYVTPFNYGIGFGYPYIGYPYFGYPYFGYAPFGYDYSYRQSRMPYRLSLQIDAIKSDYQHQIKATRKDKSITHAQRRQNIRSLKDQRDKDIADAKMNFIRSSQNNGRGMNRNPGNNNQNNNNRNNQNPDNTDSSGSSFRS